MMRRWSILPVVLLLLSCAAGSRGSSDRSPADLGGAEVGPAPDLVEELAAEDVPVLSDLDTQSDESGLDAPAESTGEPDLLSEDLLDESEILCEPAPEPAAVVTVYRDGDNSSASQHAQGLYPAYDSPLAGISVRLQDGASGQEQKSCADGTAAFGALAPGTYLLSVEAPEESFCTSKNRPRRFPQAVAQGHVVMVTIGDSIPKLGADIPFPDRLVERFSPLATIENRNQAVPGATSSDWLPEGSFFQSKALPNLPDADLVIISVGGNDMSTFLPYGPIDMTALLQKLEEFPGYMAEVTENVLVIVAAVRAAAPTADIVYCLYPNYAKSSYWQSFAGDYGGLIVTGMNNVLADLRKDLAADPELLLADMFGYFGNANLDDVLADAVHFNDLGHEAYAVEIFTLLGGVRSGEDPLGMVRMVGFGIP